MIHPARWLIKNRLIYAYKAIRGCVLCQLSEREALEFLRVMDDSLDWEQSDESIFYNGV